MHRWMDEWMVGCRHEEINPQNGHIERYNWRLFKRMPIRGWIRTPSDTISISLPTKDKTLNLHSTVFRHASLHPLLRILSPFPARAYFHVRSATTASSLYLSSSVAGKLCPFAFPKAARNSRSQFSISADFSIRLRGAASRRAYAGFFTARVSHHHHPLKKKKKKEREEKKTEERKKTRAKKEDACVPSRVPSTRRIENAVEDWRARILFPPAEPTRCKPRYNSLSVELVCCNQPSQLCSRKEISAIGMPFRSWKCRRG